jgi:hypothetical protein
MLAFSSHFPGFLFRVRKEPETHLLASIALITRGFQSVAPAAGSIEKSLKKAGYPLCHKLPGLGNQPFARLSMASGYICYPKEKVNFVGIRPAQRLTFAGFAVAVFRRIHFQFPTCFGHERRVSFPPAICVYHRIPLHLSSVEYRTGRLPGNHGRDVSENQKPDV